MKHTAFYQGRIVTPAGPVPCEPDNVDNPTDSDLHSWIRNVLEAGSKNNLDYGLEAVLYFAQNFWKTKTPTYKRLKAILFPH